MKKRIILIAICMAVFLTGLYLVSDFHVYVPNSKSVSCDDTGIVFAITTYDGKSESKPFVKCMGHTWLSIDNHTERSVWLGDIEIQPSETLTFSVWAISDHCGVVYNLEADYIAQYSRYSGRKSVSVSIPEAQLTEIAEYINLHDRWEIGKNCTYWSVQLWNRIVPEEVQAVTQTILYTPERLAQSLYEFDCVETDRDFSGADSIFFYQDNHRTELKLCS